MVVRNVLVVGAGVAGPTLAYYLARDGIDVTVVERDAGGRSSGAPVDVRGPALPAIERMGALASIRAAATSATTVTVVDAAGHRVGQIPTQTDPEAVEIPRGDLSAIVNRAAAERAEYVYGDSVVSLHDGRDGVDVIFEHGKPRRFDLVVGADGLHSRVRRLVFGPNERCVTHLGLCVATITLDSAPPDPATVLMHNAPGRMVAIHPAAGRGIAAFIFRHPAPGRDWGVDRQKQLVVDAYAGMGWRVPELLDRVRDADDLYLDAVSRVRLNSWVRGRTVLVGDAADCVSLLADGSSMAVAGAACLAGEVSRSVDDTAAALLSYEHVHRRQLATRQRGVTITSHLLVPATHAGLSLRNAALRAGSVLNGSHRNRAG